MPALDGTTPGTMPRFYSLLATAGLKVAAESAARCQVQVADATLNSLAAPHDCHRISSENAICSEDDHLLHLSLRY